MARMTTQTVVDRAKSQRDRECGPLATGTVANRAKSVRSRMWPDGDVSGRRPRQECATSGIGADDDVNGRRSLHVVQRGAEVGGWGVGRVASLGWAQP